MDEMIGTKVPESKFYPDLGFEIKYAPAPLPPLHIPTKKQLSIRKLKRRLRYFWLDLQDLIFSFPIIETALAVLLMFLLKNVAFILSMSLWLIIHWFQAVIHWKYDREED
jgi:hypothetical protein